ncbi:MAG: SIR2 family protein, partial [Promethearchaeota archaeon]
MRKQLKSTEILFNVEDKYVFLVGAGVSVDSPSCTPSALEVTKVLLKKVSMPIDYKELLRKKFRYEYIIEQFSNIIDPDLKCLDFFESITKPNLLHYFLALLLIDGHNVITTNYDYLIEKALINIHPNKEDIFLYIKKEDFIHSNFISLRKNNKIPLFKIHGSKRNLITGEDTSNSLITTLRALGKDREPGQTFTIESYKKKILERLISGKTLIVMGYSGNDKFDIIPFLLELQNLKRVIWISHSKKLKYFIKRVKEIKIKLDENRLHQIQTVEQLLSLLKTKTKAEVYHF